MRLSCLALLVVLPLPAACSPPPDRYQSAVITSSQGKLCFKVEDNAESRGQSLSITGLSINEERPEGIRTVWDSDFVRAGKPDAVVTPNECVPYAGADTRPEPLLHPGARYQVALWGSVDKKGKPESRWYRGYFCMVKAEGEMRAQQVVWDKRRDEWAWNACETPKAP